MDEASIIEHFNERAAIMEFCGGLNRADAERKAFYETKKAFGLRRMPDALNEVLRLAMSKLLEGG